MQRYTNSRFRKLKHFGTKLRSPHIDDFIRLFNAITGMRNFAFDLSDLDIVAFTTPEQQDDVFDLRMAIEQTFLPFRIDLHCWDDIPDSFKKNIEQSYVVLPDKSD